MTEIKGLAPKGYRPMWEGEIVPDSAIFKSGHKNSSVWRRTKEDAPGYIGAAFDSDEYLPQAVPVDHVPVFNAVQVPEGEDDTVEIPEGFRQLNYDEKIPYYALVASDATRNFSQVGDVIVGCTVGDAFASDAIVIARIIPEGYDVLGDGNEVEYNDQWITVRNIPDEWDKCGEYATVRDELLGEGVNDRSFIWIRKRKTADDKIRRFMEEAIALIEKYAPAFEEVGAARFAESAINDLREIVNANKG